MNNHEPAFPSPYSQPENMGLTVRDYFAAKAMQTEMLSCRQRFDNGDIEADEWEQVQQIIATYAYDMADAMMLARAAVGAA